jgi:DnaJ-domain-containing protein 1
MVVSVAGEIETPAGREPLLGKYKVRACRPAGIAKYLVDLSPLPVTQQSAPKPESATAEEDLDYYEVLQVSRNADLDTIRRVFHALAQRYHPDNKDTGDETKFRQVVEAHSVLADPEKRAAHDVKLAQDDQTRYRIFDSLESTQGVAAEIRKRKGILRLLYAKRLTDPHSPTMRARDFTEMLGCPIEHLEFAMWYLRENRLIHRSDNNRFEITYAGVEAFETEEASFANKKPFLTLPAPGTLTETA